MSGYFLILLFFFMLSLTVVLFIFLKMSFSSNFLNKFMSLGFLILMMIMMNIFMVTTSDLGKLCGLLFFLSFYSIFLMGLGYGVSNELSGMMVFKILADTFLYILMGVLYFFKMDSSLEFFNTSFQLEMEILLMIIFSVYSLLGLFGFWVYYAMEASYFVSVYMHSCGFICVGLVLFLKMSLLGMSEFHFIKDFILTISMVSYLFFVNVFMTIKDMKKSFGYFSASSICFMFLLGVSFPNMALSYFFLSSILKIVIFELMGFMNKSKHLSWWWFFWVAILYLSNYSIFVMVPVLGSLSLEQDLLKMFLFLMFFFKIYYLFVFLMKVLIIFENLEMKESLGVGVVVFKEKGLLMSFLVLGFYFLNFYLNISGCSLVTGLFFTKHIYSVCLYIFFMQVIFLSWFTLIFGEEFKYLMKKLVLMVEELKMGLSCFKTGFNLKTFNFLKIFSSGEMGVNLTNQTVMFLSFMVLVWFFY